MPPKIERYVLLEYEAVNYEFHNCEDSDVNSVNAAIRSLEKKLGKMRGGLMGYFKGHPEKIAVRLWGER